MTEEEIRMRLDELSEVTLAPAARQGRCGRTRRGTNRL